MAKTNLIRYDWDRTGDRTINKVEPQAKPKVSTKQASPTGIPRIIEVNGVKRTLRQWARASNIHRKSIHARLRRGWSIEDAVTKPNLAGQNMYRKKGAPMTTRMLSRLSSALADFANNDSVTSDESYHLDEIQQSIEKRLMKSK